MNNQRRASFTKRPAGQPRKIVIGDYPGPTPTNEVKEGACVTLRIGSEDVLVTVTKVLGNDKFSGKIKGFETSQVFEYGGYQTGEDVDFEESHLWP